MKPIYDTANKSSVVCGTIELVYHIQLAGICFPLPDDDTMLEDV